MLHKKEERRGGRGGKCMFDEFFFFLLPCVNGNESLGFCLQFILFSSL